MKGVSGSNILVVTGLLAEAAIAEGEGCVVICSGGATERLEERIRKALQCDIAGIVSFGLAGGLSPRIRAGAVILGRTIMSGSEQFPVDAVWLQLLLEKLPGALLAPLLGVDRPVSVATQKARLYVESGAVAVDMESHISARAAAGEGLPFVALRVVADTANRTLPPVALAAMKPDGGLDIAAILWSLMRQPWQLPLLAATAIEAGHAFRALRKCRRSLDDSFCFPGKPLV